MTALRKLALSFLGGVIGWILGKSLLLAATVLVWLCKFTRF